MFPSNPAGQTEDRFLSILLVEDDPSMRELVADALRREGHQVREAGDGDTALIYLLDRTWCPHPPDILVTDVRIPGHDGVTVATLLRAFGSRIPVFFMTGHPDDTLIRTAQSLGITRIFHKPFALSDLLRSISAVMSESLPFRPSSECAS